MAHGLNSVLKRGATALGCNKASDGNKTGGIGSRRIFAPHFKLQVLDSYRSDADCKGNQRATARKYGIHRRQIQKWLQVENNLRNSVGKVSSPTNNNNNNKASESAAEIPEAMMMMKSSCCGIVDAMALRCGAQHRQRDDDNSLSSSCTDACSQSIMSPCSSGGGGNAMLLEARVPPLSPIVIYHNNNNNNNAGTASAWPEENSASLRPPAPLDFTTHSRGHHDSPIAASQLSPGAMVDPAAPIDLSLKRPVLVVTARAPAVTCCPLLSSPPPLSILSSSPSLARPQQQPHPGVWDLSMKRKCGGDGDEEQLSYNTYDCGGPTRPVKLFKPYLDDLHDDDDDDSKQIELLVTSPCCSGGNNSTTTTNNNNMFSSNNSNSSSDNNYYYNNNNNNNNICEIKSEYTTTTYTLHELQPKSSSLLNYYYSIPASTYHHRGGGECCGDLSSLLPSHHFYEDSSSYGSMHGVGHVPLKQRHSYSLDFKLSAIECYYQDSVCKGNQRAVATKYNIHRRQVQKWLKQADELKQKNETIIKQIKVE